MIHLRCNLSAHCYALPLANFISAFACCRLQGILFPGLHSFLCLRALLQASRYGSVSSAFCMPSCRSAVLCTCACVAMSFDCLGAGTTLGMRGLRVLDDLISSEFICPELVVDFIIGCGAPWPAVRAGCRPCARREADMQICHLQSCRALLQRWQRCQRTPCFSYLAHVGSLGFSLWRDLTSA